MIAAALCCIVLCMLQTRGVLVAGRAEPICGPQVGLSCLHEGVQGSKAVM